MCGIFGGIGRLDAGIIREIASEAGRRGVHAWGVAWIDIDGALQSHHASGKINPEGAAYFAGEGSPLIGHARLATSGRGIDMRSPKYAQPILTDEPGSRGSVAIAHNGNIPTHQHKARALGVELKTDVDSELIARVYEKSGRDAVASLLRGHPHAVLIMQQGSLSAGRSILPLHFRETPGAVYFCSVAFEDSEKMADQSFNTWYRV